MARPVTARTLFLIPARGGSRRIPRKNVRSLAGIPLVGWAIRIARAVAGPDDMIVCSTDDPAIAEVARAWDARVLDRPASLATDDATSLADALDALDTLADGHAFDLLVLIQPTSPLTDPADLAAAVELGRRAGRSVTSVATGQPGAWRYGRDEDGTLRAGDDRSGLDHVLTGGFYVVAPEALRRVEAFVEPGVTIGQVVPRDRAIDIDVPDDLVAAAATLRARPVPPVVIDGYEVGERRTFVIAEAGVNHDGDPDRAMRLIDAAADAGADAVKFQTFQPDALAAAATPTATYQQQRGGGADQRLMLERLALPVEAWADLQRHARSRGIVFMSTPFDDASADLLDRLDVPAFKVGSGELTNVPFLARLARLGRPMIVSTGMATMTDVAVAVEAIRAVGPDGGLALLHCVSSYPAAAGDANLSAIRMLRDAFGVPTGWSDHSLGTELAIAAVALGASIVEKHLTLDRAAPGPDHAMSLERPEFGAMVTAIRSTEAAIGGHDKAPTEAEREVAAVARRSLHWARDLPIGAVIGEDHVVALRPGTGIPPARIGALIGRTTSRAVAAGAIVTEDDA